MVMMHNAELADRTQKLGALLRYDTSLGPRLSELAILAVARHWSCHYEWHWHAPEAAKAGISDAVIEAIKHRRRPPLSQADETAVYDFTCELQANRSVSDPTYEKAVELLGTTGVVELTALNGYYAMIAMTLNEHRVPLPDGGEPQLPV
jgi:4-carboxymuconolactone decarboxylase